MLMIVQARGSQYQGHMFVILNIRKKKMFFFWKGLNPICNQTAKYVRHLWREEASVHLEELQSTKIKITDNPKLYDASNLQLIWTKISCC